MKRFMELRSSLPTAAMEADGHAYVASLLTLPQTRPGKVAVVGYCFTGSMAMRVAAAEPDKVGAAASFHGGGLYTSEADSPHLLLPKIKSRLYFGHAIEDRSIPAEAIAALEDALRAWGGKFESEMYEGALHGWTQPDREPYNPQQAERHHEKMLDLLKRTVG